MAATFLEREMMTVEEIANNLDTIKKPSIGFGIKQKKSSRVSIQGINNLLSYDHELHRKVCDDFFAATGKVFQTNLSKSEEKELIAIIKSCTGGESKFYISSLIQKIASDKGIYTETFETYGPDGVWSVFVDMKYPWEYKKYEESDQFLMIQNFFKIRNFFVVCKRLLANDALADDNTGFDCDFACENPYHQSFGFYIDAKAVTLKSVTNMLDNSQKFKSRVLNLFYNFTGDRLEDEWPTLRDEPDGLYLTSQMLLAAIEESLNFSAFERGKLYYENSGESQNHYFLYIVKHLFSKMDTGKLPRNRVFCDIDNSKFFGDRLHIYVKPDYYWNLSENEKCISESDVKDFFNQCFSAISNSSSKVQVQAGYIGYI